MLALPPHLFAASALLCPSQHAGYRQLRSGATRCTAAMAASWYDAGIRLDTAAEQRSRAVLASAAGAVPSDPAGRWPGWWDKTAVAEENPAFATENITVRHNTFRLGLAAGCPNARPYKTAICSRPRLRARCLLR